MPGRHRRDEVLADDDLAVHAVGQFTGRADQGQVGRAVAHVLDQAVRTIFGQRGLDTRIGQVERGQSFEQRLDRAGRDHTDREPAADQAVDLVDGLPQGGGRRQHGPRVADGRLPRRGQRDRAAGPVEQLRAEVPLQLADLRTDAGLADVGPFGAAGEVGLVRDRDQVLELT